TDEPTIGNPSSASRMHVYGDVHCFRGSDDLLSFLHDADCRLMSPTGLGKVHAGFWDALSDILPACLELPRPAAITGHSLGAAMAVLYAGVLARLGTIVPVYATRNGNDLVTQIPFDMTLPGPLTQIGTARLPFDNVQDHDIGLVIE